MASTQISAVSAVLPFQWEGPAREISALMNEKAFLFSHHLSSHPLFEIPRLRDLAHEISAQQRVNDLYFDAGDIKINDKWGQIPKSEMTVDQAFENIWNAKAWVIMKHLELDPGYAKVLADCTQQVLALAPPALKSLLHSPEMLVIVSSPKRITPIHIDGEVNFLVQIAGSKLVHVFDRYDRSAVTEQEIERFYTVDKFALDFKPGIEERASTYMLAPGNALHIPVTAPHWVQNGDEPSISLSINYELPTSVRADVYSANYHLRKLGWNPAAPGHAKILDRVKAASFRTATKARRALRGK